MGHSVSLYAHVTGTTIDQIGALPSLWHDGVRWWDLRGASDTTAALAGWRPVVTTPRPADTATDTTTYSVALVAGVPTETWTPRPWTPTELADRLAATNRQALTGTTSLQGRLDRLAAYKTDTDLAAVLAQTNNQALATASLNRALKALVRENQRQSATIALLVRLIDPALLANITDTTDT